jgi:hypothetical protein
MEKHGKQCLMFDARSLEVKTSLHRTTYPSLLISSGDDFRLSLIPISAGDRGSIPRGRDFFFALVLLHPALSWSQKINGCNRTRAKKKSLPRGIEPRSPALIGGRSLTSQRAGIKH